MVNVRFLKVFFVNVHLVKVPFHASNTKEKEIREIEGVSCPPYFHTVEPTSTFYPLNMVMSTFYTEIQCILVKFDSNTVYLYDHMKIRWAVLWTLFPYGLPIVVATYVYLTF